MSDFAVGAQSQGQEGGGFRLRPVLLHWGTIYTSGTCQQPSAQHELLYWSLTSESARYTIQAASCSLQMNHSMTSCSQVQTPVWKCCVKLSATEDSAADPVPLQIAITLIVHEVHLSIKEGNSSVTPAKRSFSSCMCNMWCRRKKVRKLDYLFFLWSCLISSFHRDVKQNHNFQNKIKFLFPNPQKI